jgi:hypothetical protein
MSSTHIPSAGSGTRSPSEAGPHLPGPSDPCAVTINHATPDERRCNAQVGERIELARYAVSSGERVLYGQRVDGVLCVTDAPVTGHRGAFLVERGLERDGDAALSALIADYLDQARRLDQIPMGESVLARYLAGVQS